MKLMRYSRRGESASQSRLGVLLAGDLVADLQAGYALYLVDETGNRKGPELARIYIPAYIAEFLQTGEPAWLALGDAYSYLSELSGSAPGAKGLAGEPLFLPLSECRLFAPVRPPKLIAIGRNYPGYTSNPGKQRGSVPAAFMKSLSAITGPGRDIVRPRGCTELDYETELAVVIGKKCKHVPEHEAYSVVAGYTIVNDITARDVGRREREGGHLFLAKTFDTFAPMGPWLVTREAIPDPMRLRIVTRVNGEVRQDGNTGDMLWSIPKLISYMSQITLMPGDVISTGSPGGGGLANPDWLLKPGDVIEAEVEGVGVLRNAVVDAPAS